MIVKKKYIMSNGLAFSEQKDMTRLHELSKQGWHVKKFSFLGYTLEKGTEKDWIYEIDYRILEDGDDEYLELFNQAGWSHVDSQANIHLFKAAPETKSLYTDDATHVEKYKSSLKPLQITTISFIPITLLSWYLYDQTTQILQTFLLILSILLTVLTIPLAWTTLAATSNKWKVEQKNSLVTFSKWIPYLIVLLAVITLFLFESQPLRILSAACIGGIGCILLIYATMSLLHKIRKA